MLGVAHKHVKVKCNLLERKDGPVGRVRIWDSGDPNSIPCSMIDVLHDLGQVTQSLWVSVPCPYEENRTALSHRAGVRINTLKLVRNSKNMVMVGTKNRYYCLFST